MNFDIGVVLTRAWQITWKNKVLWAITALPFVITFLIFPLWLVIVFTQDFDPNRIEGLVENPTFVIIGSLFYVLIIGVSIILQVISQASVALGIYKLEAESKPIAFIGLLKDSFQYFWRVLGVILLISSVIGLFFVVFFACIAALSAVTMGIAAICLQPLFLIMIPLFLLITTVMEQAEAAVIADGMGVTDSVKRGYELIRANLGKYTLITIVIYIGMNILIGFVMFPLMIPMFFIMMRNMDAGIDFSSMMRMQAVFGVVVFPIMAVLQGFSLTYLKSAMMVTYLRLTRSANTPQPVLQEVAA